MCGRSWNSSRPVFNIAKALDVNSFVEEDGIALLAKHVKLSVITGMRARMTEQIFALNAWSGQGNCYWYDLYFQCYCFWQSYRLCRCLLATKSFFKNVGSAPKPEESECEGVCYSTHTAAFGDSDFQETSREVSSTDNNMGLNSSALRAWDIEARLSKCAPRSEASCIHVA